METYPFICEETTYQAYGYLPFKDFPEGIYNYFCKGRLPHYANSSSTANSVVLLFRDNYPGITRWTTTPGSCTKRLPLLTLDQLKELAFIDSLEN